MSRARRFRSWAWAMLAALCLLSASPALAQGAVAPPSAEVRTRPVTTKAGQVVGVRRGASDWFLGIPYAAPPVGDLRWKPPAAPSPWRSAIDASRFRDWCLQVAPEGFSKPIVNEDCLYLNIVAPHRDGAGKKRPVMVWIHGGGLRQGRSNDYDPTPLVEKGEVVFVSFNYRLNILGFLAHPALDAEGHPFANYGLMDQQAALAWVRDNIAAFGGDPQNVTLFGESSGGANVFDHIASPRSARLFDKAIVQSGSLGFGAFAPFYDGVALSKAQEVGRSVSKLAGCLGADEAACLRSLSPAQLAALVRKLPSYAFGVVVDGTILDQPVTRRITSGDFNRVPIINGSNHDEWTWVEGLSERAAGRPLSEAELPAHLAPTLGDFATKALPHYPVAAFGGSAGVTSARVVTDGLFMCPLLGLNATLSKHTKVWGFEFNDRDAQFPFPAASFPYGAAHTLEMQYLFKNFTGAVGVAKPMSASQARLSDAMIGYWTAFAKHGDPNARGLTSWPALSVGSPTYLSLVAPQPQPIASKTIADEHLCGQVWDDTVGRLPKAQL